MLKELRQALADTIADSLAELEARVVAFPPKSIDMPPSGIFVYVQPDTAYVTAWQTFSAGGRGTVRFSVVCLVTDGNPAVAWDRLDDLVDPLSTAPNVFGAIYANPDLGVSSFEAQATALLEDVQTAQRISEADGSVTFYELTLPVQVIVQRS